MVTFSSVFVWKYIDLTNFRRSIGKKGNDAPLNQSSSLIFDALFDQFLLTTMKDEKGGRVEGTGGGLNASFLLVFFHFV